MMFNLRSYSWLSVSVLFLAGCDPAYTVRYGSKLNYERDTFGYVKIDQSDSTVAEILNSVDQTIAEFGLVEDIDKRNSGSENYYFLKSYYLPKNERKRQNYEYQFLNLSVFYDAEESQLVIKIVDFPTRRQSRISKSLEDSLIRKLQHSIDNGKIYRIQRKW